MKIIQNPNKKQYKKIKKMIEENDGYCPCRLIKNEDTKCMCKDFRDKVKLGQEGLCHCGAYLAQKE